MMEFRTPVLPLRLKGLIGHDKPVIMVGSCFADNIGNRMRDELFDVEVNPFGTLYNPASILSASNDVIGCRQYSAGDLFCYEGRYHSFSHHSRFSGTDADSVLEKINCRIKSAHSKLKNANVICVTFGTAYVYRFMETGKVVSNCHKLPQSEFIRTLLTVDDIVGLWLPLIDRLHEFNPEIKMVFTVSPIRHMADGAHGNQVSKSTLLLAVDRLVSSRQDVALYFPAYEIMMDDLRDYRFYAEDMVHPSPVAVDYIYDKFSKSFFDIKTETLAGECRKVTRRLNHRMMSDDKTACERFEASTRQVIDNLLLAHPHLRCAVDDYLNCR